MKFIKKLLLSFLICLFLISSLIYLGGKNLYDKKISEIPLSTKIQSIKDNKNFVSIKDLPSDYLNAIVSVEDHRYFNHGPIDPIALLRALISNIRQKEFKEGGSTLTQQTAKNLYFISEENVINRKVAEIILSFELEKNYTKNDILEIYVNTIYFGDGYYGIKEACNGYFHKEPKDMNLYESTMLAGIPNAPSIYAPTKNFKLTKSRQKKVISSMVDYNYLNNEQANQLYLQIDTATFK